MSLTLNRTELTEEKHGSQSVWPLIVQAVSGESGFPSEIFVYHVFPEPADIEEVFECVASLPQLSDIDTQVTAFTPYLRKDTLRFDCRTPEDAEDLWVRVKQDCSDLLWNYRYAAGLSLDEQVVIA